MICPKCHDLMKTISRGSVHVEQCERCHGVFLDGGELEQIIAAERAHYALPHQPGGAPGSPPAYSPAPYSPAPMTPVPPAPVPLAPVQAEVERPPVEQGPVEQGPVEQPTQLAITAPSDETRVARVESGEQVAEREAAPVTEERPEGARSEGARSEGAQAPPPVEQQAPPVEQGPPPPYQPPPAYQPAPGPPAPGAVPAYQPPPGSAPPPPVHPGYYGQPGYPPPRRRSFLEELLD
ncbi:zf-TFIIB domain-containing protein [Saccharothrix longispora]|uniref:Zn-finger nucleic acid-binding protein n=1 Tax=Saccharothrix longispora TaxID=33920 RepID=A0ABU1Q2B4_9PSEU|nr:zf-TFIIB domain-containing protein [Saccharothrix longispora]MDR6597031.1 Zn-finger nucleic acid-binding protein [Saccharothrix longispora]